MLGSAIIEVIIGLAFVYILLSLLVAQINEIISNIMNLRARTLRRRVEALIFDEQLQERVLAHPVVGIVRPPIGVDRDKSRDERTARVTNVAANSFAKAMVNILSDPFLDAYAALTTIENEDERRRLQDILNTLKANLNDPARANAVLNHYYETVQQLEPAERPDRRALLRTLSPLQTAVREIQSGNSGFLQLLSGIQQVDNRAFQQTMETVLSTVQTLDEAETAIEEWYDNKMAQTKATYARYMGYMSLLVGLLISVLLNIDSLYMARSLWIDSSLREQINVAANAAFINFESGSGIFGPTPQTDTEDPVEQLAENVEEAQAILSELLELSLPIGWTFRFPSEDEVVAPATTPDIPDTETTPTEDDANGAVAFFRFYDPLEDSRNLYNLIPFFTSNWLWNVVIKIIGLLTTAFAVAQGAPFWFDVLRRLSGQKSPSKADTEAA